MLPQFKGPSMAHCLIYIPSYFDYVRIRNYFKKETMNFVQICEYTKVNYYCYYLTRIKRNKYVFILGRKNSESS